ncbi:hypothetical protein FQA39_LY12865 [Lamprigera yunnana]|nr:hypothetical protein FQA39_LY12865 [Lamprigera yunnana]
MGNSEVGHIHLGAGRISFESLAKLNKEVRTNQIGLNKEIVAAFEHAKQNNSALHLMGLFSDGGVHSHMNHMIAVYEAAVKYGLTNIKFDLITDGRDTAPKNKLLEEVAKDEYDLIVLNFANCDMVGHTGDNDATVKGVKVLDEQLKRIHDEFVLKHNGVMVITADHGNAEIMILITDGQPNKKHTTSFVPIIVTDTNVKLSEVDPAIAKVAPTILELMDIAIPQEMTEPSMIVK